MAVPISAGARAAPVPLRVLLLHRIRLPFYAPDLSQPPGTVLRDAASRPPSALVTTTGSWHLSALPVPAVCAQSTPSASMVLLPPSRLQYASRMLQYRVRGGGLSNPWNGAQAVLTQCAVQAIVIPRVWGSACLPARS